MYSGSCLGVFLAGTLVLPQRGKTSSFASLGSAGVARQDKYMQDALPAPCLHAPLKTTPSHPQTISIVKLKTVSERAPPAREEMGLSLPQTKPAN